MVNTISDRLQRDLSGKSLDKLLALDNPKLHRFVADAIELCQPEDVFVCTDSAEDIERVRKFALEWGEEAPLAIEGHTVHYDGYNDQARDKPHTKYLVPKGMDLGADINATEADAGRAEVRDLLRGSMKGHVMLVRFLCLGPTQSEFSVPCCQITDSAYVGHSLSLLYRAGYGQFKSIGDSGEFFRILHSAGELDGRKVSKNVDKRRVYIDIDEELVYSVNTQYAGNTVGLKKLSLRLAIRKAAREGWLAEHMFLLGSHGPGGRVTYFSGAFPSMCGKTSTAMLHGETIVGDDLAYLRKRGRAVYGANVESGIFGIIQDVNAKDAPGIWEAITTPREVIFSNVLVSDDGVPYWLGDGRDAPKSGENHSGKWTADKKDAEGNPIPLAHKNARYTIRQRELSNCDPNLDNPNGVPVAGIIYGGRDSDISVPVEQSFDWVHGVITKGASIESETTAATLGKEGVRAFNPMSNLDFLSMPIGSYVQRHLDFAVGVDKLPSIFGVNYFQKADGKYITGMHDKRVWVKWMELRVHGEVEALSTPTGLIPLCVDLEWLFEQVLDTDYTEAQYVEQFSCRVPQNLAKIERIEKIYRDAAHTPPVLFEVLQAQRERLLAAQAKHGDLISPLAW